MTEYPEFRMSTEEAFCRLFRIHVNQTEAAKGTEGGKFDRILQAEVLGYKVVQHALSALALFRGVQIPELAPHSHYRDAFSILGLARMCHESFLLFNHLFVTPATREEAEFRFLAWSYVDSAKQARFPVSSDEGKELLKSVLEFVKEFRSELEENSLFKELSDSKRNKILVELRWPLLTWNELGKEAGFNELHALHVYRYLCSYAHPGSLSVRQLRLALGTPMQPHFMEMGLKHCAIMLACLASDYSKPFPKSFAIPSDGGDDSRLVKLYEHFARGNC